MSNKIIVSWDNFYINIIYYIANLSGKEVIVICHKNDNYEDFIKCDNTTIKTSMPFWNTRGYMDGIYNTLTFNGKLITGIETDSDILKALS